MGCWSNTTKNIQQQRLERFQNTWFINNEWVTAAKGTRWHLSFRCRSALMFTYCARVRRCTFSLFIWKRGVVATEVVTDRGLTSHFTSLNRWNSSPRFVPFPGLPGAQCALVSVIKIDDLKWQRHMPAAKGLWRRCNSALGQRRSFTCLLHLPEGIAKK